MSKDVITTPSRLAGIASEYRSNVQTGMCGLFTSWLARNLKRGLVSPDSAGSAGSHGQIFDVEKACQAAPSANWRTISVSSGSPFAISRRSANAGATFLIG